MAHPIKETKGYRISAIVFSKHEFYPKEMRRMLAAEGFRMTEKEVIELLENYRYYGLLAKVGSKYAINR